MLGITQHDHNRILIFANKPQIFVSDYYSTDVPFTKKVLFDFCAVSVEMTVLLMSSTFQAQKWSYRSSTVTA